MIHQEIILSGFGGQGILSAGRLLSYTGMLENKYVSWIPSYGPEMRGGTANCHVIISNNIINSPILNTMTTLIAMNIQSVERFQNNLKKDGIIIYDNSITQITSFKDDKTVFMIPATNIASELGNVSFANIILIGKLIRETKIITRDKFIEALYKVLPEKKHYLIPSEIKALDIGIGY